MSQAALSTGSLLISPAAPLGVDAGGVGGLTLWLWLRIRTAPPQVSLRKVLVGVHIALAVVGVADTILALRLNVAWGIDDKSVSMS